jgi:predicted dehydrogenase
LALGQTDVPALCDIDSAAAGIAAEMVEGAGQPKPETYTDNETVFESLLAREDLDAVLVATPWNWHTPMAVAAMNHGKAVGVEVPAALTVEECWQLVDTHERTGVTIMMLENWCFRRDNLAVLNMVRAGLFGETVYCHCAYSHNCVGHWYFDKEGNPRWGAGFLEKYNRDQYPTHGEGPVMSWLDINHGDAYASLSSTATSQRGINAHFRRKYGPDHPFATKEFKQGDVVTTVVRTQLGKTIVINFDMQLPRPYDNRWTLQGTTGIYNQQRNGVYFESRGPAEPDWESFDGYQKEFDHKWWTDMSSQEIESGHGGTDSLELKLFLQSVREGTPPPVDVYDSATMSSVVGLSGESIEKGGAPVECPDFTRGKWKERKPVFGLVS